MFREKKRDSAFFFSFFRLQVNSIFWGFSLFFVSFFKSCELEDESSRTLEIQSTRLFFSTLLSLLLLVCSLSLFAPTLRAASTHTLSLLEGAPPLEREARVPNAARRAIAAASVRPPAIDPPF